MPSRIRIYAGQELPVTILSPWILLEVGRFVRRLRQRFNLNGCFVPWWSAPHFLAVTISVAGGARKQFGVVGQASRLSRIAQDILTVW